VFAGGGSASFDLDPNVDGDPSATTLRHYTTSANAELIKTSGLIRPGETSGKIWLTPDPYPNGPAAKSALALPTTPDGYFDVPTDRIVSPSAPGRVEPTDDGPGGGTEITTESPIDSGGLEFTPFEG
jgi:hypothetical protein